MVSFERRKYVLRVHPFGFGNLFQVLEQLRPEPGGRPFGANNSVIRHQSWLNFISAGSELRAAAICVVCLSV